MASFQHVVKATANCWRHIPRDKSTKLLKASTEKVFINSQRVDLREYEDDNPPEGVMSRTDRQQVLLRDKKVSDRYRENLRKTNRKENAANLAAFRKSFGITQSDMGLGMEVPQGQVSRIEGAPYRKRQDSIYKYVATLSELSGEPIGAIVLDVFKIIERQRIDDGE